jgi:hypothetical protein
MMRQSCTVLSALLLLALGCRTLCVALYAVRLLRHSLLRCARLLQCCYALYAAGGAALWVLTVLVL